MILSGFNAVPGGYEAMQHLLGLPTVNTLQLNLITLQFNHAYLFTKEYAFHKSIEPS